jgi:hypothetical protein
MAIYAPNTSHDRFCPVKGTYWRSYKPTKAKTPARTLGFLGNQMVARGGIDQGLRMFNPAHYQLMKEMSEVHFLNVRYVD